MEQVVASIDAVDVSVVYPVFTTSARSLKNKVLSQTTGGRIAGRAARHTLVHALDNVSFKAKSGERIGVIGHNGSGKSTLLRVMAGIYHPVSGSISVQGRVAALFDTGFGMDEDSTGYENIFLRGLYLGLSRTELAQQADDIAAFTGLGDFLDLPIRTYSTGMKARLAFAVSTAVNADVLLIDEAIGSGDAAFMAKAEERLNSFIERAPIVVLSSHDPAIMVRFCTRGIVLQQGRITYDGPIEDALNHHTENTGRNARGPEMHVVPCLIEDDTNDHVESVDRSTGAPERHLVSRSIRVGFDPDYYLTAYPDIATAGIDPYEHYVTHGWREGRNPSPEFNTQYYLASNADVAAADICPLIHYVQFGSIEGRLPKEPVRTELEHAMHEIHTTRQSRLENVVSSSRRTLTFPSNGISGSLALEKLNDIFQKEIAATDGMLLTVSHDDYAKHLGGVQICVRDEERLATDAGYSYLHLSPWQPMLALSDNVDAHTFYVALRLNGQGLGAISIADLAQALATLPSTYKRYAIIHHLMGFSPELVGSVMEALRPEHVIAWVHDYFLLCPNYTLMRNDLEHCGAPDMASIGCQVCCHGRGRSAHVERINAFFNIYRPSVLAPSEETLALWRRKFVGAFHNSACHPHGELIVQERLERKSKTTMNVAFVGTQAFQKGSHVFDALARKHSKDPRYRFFKLGMHDADAHAHIETVQVAVTGANRKAMEEAIIAHDIDVVVFWALWPETFSFVAHEALAGGALLIVPKSAGYATSLAEANSDQSLILDNESELFELFESGQLCGRDRSFSSKELKLSNPLEAYLAHAAVDQYA